MCVCVCVWQASQWEKFLYIHVFLFSFFFFSHGNKEMFVFSSSREIKYSKVLVWVIYPLIQIMERKSTLPKGHDHCATKHAVGDYKRCDLHTSENRWRCDCPFSGRLLTHGTDLQKLTLTIFINKFILKRHGDNTGRPIWNEIHPTARIGWTNVSPQHWVD